ncbi:MAG TPA: HNH endonuclease, partial [Candidatus Acidoferrum sp.]|nr:HNH endonuclease [Candidatus Acidoferrum sp.]
MPYTPPQPKGLPWPAPGTRARRQLELILRRRFKVHSTGYYVTSVARLWACGLLPGVRKVHRIIASLCLDRPLSPTEEIHHRNGNCVDNRPSNLCVSTRAEHK